VEQIFKSLFSDYQPRDIALKRPDQVARDDKRRQEALDKAEKERIEAIEKARGVADNTAPPVTKTR
jgi:manganese-transporting P-type ATPase